MEYRVQTQIPFGNDNQKGECNDKSKCEKQIPAE